MDSVLDFLARHFHTQSYNWIRIAGCAGAIGIAFGAYAAHSKSLTELERNILNRATQYNFLTCTALLALPATRCHPLSMATMTLGAVCFSGVLYLKVMLGTKTYFLPPTGGILMMIGWLSLLFKK